VVILSVYRFYLWYVCKMTSFKHVCSFDGYVSNIVCSLFQRDVNRVECHLMINIMSRLEKRPWLIDNMEPYGEPSCKISRCIAETSPRSTRDYYNSTCPWDILPLRGWGRNLRRRIFVSRIEIYFALFKKRYWAASELAFENLFRLFLIISITNMESPFGSYDRMNRA
jgi:hypothetical protein